MSGRRRSSPSKGDTGRNNHGAPIAANSIGTVEDELFGNPRSVRQAAPTVATLKVLLDCGKCWAETPQADVRAGTFDSSCGKRHNRSRT